MLTSMNIRCDQCGHESDPRYRFCGMCGAKLPPPPARPTEAIAARPERDEPMRSVGAPSFLGLNEEPTSSVTYLLEDELSTSHWGRRVVLILFLVALGIAGWYWRSQLRAYVTAKLAQAPTNNQGEVSLPSAAPISSAAPEAPPAIPNANTPPPKPEPGVSDLPATPPPSSATPVANSAALPSPSPQSDAVPQAAQPDQSAEKPPRTAQDQSPKADPQVSKSTPPQVQRPVPEANPGDQLEAEGERYLYGTGVPVNCSRAQKDLQTAAGQGNTKAYSVLGTIYATGHCTDRDLPLAYHWFAKALQQDPGNTRLQRDLQVLWSQMTADERQIAMSTRH
jgi:hypothetical protein